MMTVDRVSVRSIADLRGRRVVVLGLARSGLAASRFLADAGADVTVYDRRPAGDLADAVAALGTRSVRLALGAEDTLATGLIADADLVVTSPSISAEFPTTEPWLRQALRDAGARGTPVIGEVDLFLRLTAARIVGVTGTKGKTTTASLVAAMFEAAGTPHALGGNIGTPLIEEVETLTAETWAVLELSELQLPTISRGADIAVYTNITADHLDRHGSVEAYRAVKGRLAELTATRSGTLVLNVDDDGCRQLAGRVRGAEILWYGMDDLHLEATVEGDQITLLGRAILPVSEVQLPGRAMLADVLAAALGASVAGVDAAAIADGIRGFRGVPHRLETVRVLGGVRFVNDSQATIPEAAIAALDAFGAPVVLIAGGKDKGLDYHAFADAIAARAHAAVLIGETAARLQELIGDRVSLERAPSMERAVERAAVHAQPGDVVLLSPAAASFDMFVDYLARGDAFRRAVAGLPNEEETA
jgi:UDP-N-acetylmuramoylalanine--D-glutamate ligase